MNINVLATATWKPQIEAETAQLQLLVSLDPHRTEIVGNFLNILLVIRCFARKGNFFDQNMKD